MKSFTPFVLVASLLSTGCLFDRTVGRVDPDMVSVDGGSVPDAGPNDTLSNSDTQPIDANMGANDGATSADGQPTEAGTCLPDGRAMSNGSSCMAGYDCCSNFCGFGPLTMAQECANGATSDLSGMFGSNCNSYRDCSQYHWLDCHHDAMTGVGSCGVIPTSQCDRASCDTDIDCCTGICIPTDPALPRLGNAGLCNRVLQRNGGTCATLGATCEVNADCCSNICDPATSHCATPAGSTCVELGGACTSGTACCGTGLCTAGFCRP